MNGLIKIKKEIVQTLKNMNTSFITNNADYDYRFISYLITEVFSKENLAESAVYKPGSVKHKFNSLDQTKLTFVEDVFKERTGNETKRTQELPNLINKKCKILRQNKK